MVQRAVEHCRFSGSGGTRHEHEAVGSGERLAQTTEVRRVVAERLEILRGRLTVDDAHDHLLAVDRRQRREPHVDGAAVDPQAKCAVLRPVANGDVCRGHHLEAIPHGRRRLGRQREHLLEDAAQPVAEAQPGSGGLDVDVAGARFDRPRDDVIAQVDDRRVGLERHILAVEELHRCRRSHAAEQQIDGSHHRVMLIERAQDFRAPRQHRDRASA